MIFRSTYVFHFVLLWLLIIGCYGSVKLNNDGRANSPLVEGENFVKGKYELVFYIGDYFKNISSDKDIPFLDDVVIRFGISNPSEHYHVPLLVSPWSYSTYRGS